MDSTMEIFEMIKGFCQNQLPAGPYSLWIKDIECEKLNHKEAVLVVSNDIVGNSIYGIFDIDRAVLLVGIRVFFRNIFMDDDTDRKFTFPCYETHTDRASVFSVC